MLICSRILHAT